MKPDEVIRQVADICRAHRAKIEEKIQKAGYKRSDSSLTLESDGFDLLYCGNMT